MKTSCDKCGIKTENLTVYVHRETKTLCDTCYKSEKEKNEVLEKLNQGDAERVKRLHPTLQDFAAKLLNNGFRLLIYIPNDKRPVTWLHYELNGNLGYCQVDRWEYKLRFSTVHKPCREAGTGYGLNDEFEGIENPTIDDAKKAFILKPIWANKWHPSNFIPSKYKDLEEYMSHETVLKYDLINGI